MPKPKIPAFLLALLVFVSCGSQEEPPPWIELALNFQSTPLQGLPATLCGSLMLPSENANNLPAVLLVSGSEAMDRNGAIASLPALDRSLDNSDGLLDGWLKPTQPFRFFQKLSEILVQDGFAVLRYDNRAWLSANGSTCGETPGSGPFTTYAADAYTDASKALAALKARPEVNASRVFVLGYAQGAAFALRLAGQATAGIAISAHSSAMDAWMLQGLQARVTYLRTQEGAGLAEAENALQQAQKAFPLIRAGRWPITDLLFGWGKFYWESWLAFTDETPLLVQNLTTPILIVRGSLDFSVSAQEQSGFMAWGASEKLTLRTLDGLTQTLSQPDQTSVEPAAVQLFAAWMQSIP